MYLARVNTLALVKQGFSRDEIFFMPISEMQDYIKILNQQTEEINNNIESTKIDNSINDIKMAGNTL